MMENPSAKAANWLSIDSFSIQFMYSLMNSVCVKRVKVSCECNS